MQCKVVGVVKVGGVVNIGVLRGNILSIYYCCNIDCLFLFLSYQEQGNSKSWYVLILSIISQTHDSKVTNLTIYLII